MLVYGRNIRRSLYTNYHAIIRVWECFGNKPRDSVTLIISPIAIAYSMRQIIKSVCVCLSVCLSVCVCPCVVTLTVAFLCGFSPNLIQRCRPPKVRTSSLGLKSPHPFPYFTPKNRYFGPEVLKINANMKNAISALNVHVSPKFLRVIRNRGRGTRRWRQIFDRK